MILPNKHLRTRYSLLGLGSLLLIYLKRPLHVSALWEKVRSLPEVGTFERFTLTLDLLFILDVIEFKENKLQRVQK